MKPLINWKQKAGLMALGSIFTIIGLLLSPISAQKGNKFGDIECTSLTVQNGRERRVTIDDTLIFMWHPQAHTLIGHGYADFLEKQKEGDDWLGRTNIEGGDIRISDAPLTALVKIGMGEHGGYVSTHTRIKSKGHAIMGVNEFAEGTVSTYNEDGYPVSQVIEE